MIPRVVTSRAYRGTFRLWVADLRAPSPHPYPTSPRLAPALHIAYLSRNFKVASELLEHGASDTLRDEIGKTAPQMLELNKPVRRRSALLGSLAGRPSSFAAWSFSGEDYVSLCRPAR